jgi:hypothetical protein
MAGSVTVSKYQFSQDKKVLVIKLACIGDSSNGSVPNTTVTAAAITGMTDGDPLYNVYALDYTTAGFSLAEVWVVDGTPAPDAADITITDALGCSLYTEEGIIPTSGTKQGSVTAALVTSALTMAVANQATASAKYDVYLKLTR